MSTPTRTSVAMLLCRLLSPECVIFREMTQPFHMTDNVHEIVTATTGDLVHDDALKIL